MLRDSEALGAAAADIRELECVCSTSTAEELPVLP